ncbi:YcaO-like family protein [Streptomyces sp. NPDC058459]|uniref:YcaO-like family protein n=1 Tax=Streptomyces sp. NPDC058459 TaxID=3346508 RepID=UPI003666E432
MPYPLLTDPRTGIVRRLSRRPVPDHFPQGFELVASPLCDTTRFCPWPADSAGAGHAFADPDAALGAALGEAAERYCGNLVPDRLVRASYTELRRRGLRAVDPDSLALYGPQQYADPAFPLTAFTRDLTVEWTEGTDLADGGAVLVPASLVWVSYVSADVEPRGPRTNPVIQAGLAAGATYEDACLGALCEVVERDAMTIGWHGRAGLRVIRPPDWLDRFARGPHDRLTTRFLAFPSSFGPRVAGALVRDTVTGYLTLGVAARADEDAACLKAYGEALQLQLFTADYDDPTGPYMRAAADPRSPLKPWRAARDYGYGDAYRRDLRDVVDYGCHLQLYLDPRVQDAFERELQRALQEGTGGAEGAEAGRDTAPEAAAPTLDALVARVGAAGHRAVVVDVTTPDVRAAGPHVVRVVVPGLYSNTAAGLPFLGGTRLAAALAGEPRRVLPLPH